MERLAEETSETVIGVCGGQDWVRVGVCDGSVSKAGADDSYEYRGDGDAEECKREDLPGFCVGGVVAIVVCGDGAPTRSRGEVDGHEAEPRAGERKTMVLGGKAGVDFIAHFANQDQHQDEGYNPRVLFVCVDQGESEDRDHIADYGDDYTAYGDCHGVVGDGGENLSNHHYVDNCESTSNDNVED